MKTKVIIFFVFLAVLPIAFLVIFDGKETSYLLGVEVHMSVEDWFSFWISYLSLLVSSLLAISAYELSIVLQENEIRNKIKENRLSFCVEKIQLLDVGKYEFEIRLPLSILTISEVEVISARLQIASKWYPFVIVKQIQEGETFFKIAVQDLDENTKEAFAEWIDYFKRMNSDYHYADLDITFSYKFDKSVNRILFNKTRESKQIITIQTRAEIGMEMDCNSSINLAVMKNSVISPFSGVN